MLKNILSHFNKSTDKELNRNPVTTPVRYVIDSDKCRSCGGCKRGCKAGAISGGWGKAYVIDEQKCVKCGTCMKRCRASAIKCS